MPSAYQNTTSGTTTTSSTSTPKVFIKSNKEILYSNGLATLTFTFDSTPYGFSFDDIRVTNGVLTGLVADPLLPNVFTATFFGGIVDRSGMSTIQVEGAYVDQAGNLGSPSNTVSIKNEAETVAATVGFATNNVSIVEGNAARKLVTFDVFLSTAINSEVTAYYSTGSKSGTATAGSDFVAQTGSVVFLPGETQKTVTIEIIGDNAYEGNEYLYLEITAATGATVVLNGAEGYRNSWIAATIANDDAAPAPTVGFASNNAAIVEGNDGVKLMQFAVSLSAPAVEPVSIDFSTAKRAGTATSGVDFLAQTGSLMFAPGEVTKMVSIEIVGDTKYEANEYFYLDLLAASGATIVTNGAEGFRNSWVMATIQNDDASLRPTVAFAKNNQTIIEGNAGTKLMQFTVSLSGPATDIVTVDYSTEKRIGPAKAFQDYVPLTGTLVFNPGETTKTISVEIVGDSLYEASEYFYVDLLRATGADVVINGSEGLRNSWVMASISNDDLPSAPVQIGGVIGTTSTDRIGGTAHAELIDGRGGADIITGYAGRDTFVFAPGYATSTLEGAARITDFQDRFDLLSLTGGLKFADLVVTQIAEGTLVSLSNGSALVVLVGVQSGLIDVSDFVF